MKNRWNRLIVAGIILSLLSPMNSIGAEEKSEEKAELVFQGSLSSEDILKNIDFLDLKAGNPWSKEAVYTSGALEIMKGYGDRIFGRYNNLTREQALALAYRAAGREEEAQIEAEKFAKENASAIDGEAASIYWANGYYGLARKDGFITESDYNALTNLPIDEADPQPLTFNRNEPASRQEFAYYLGKLLNFSGVRGQQKLFNNFNDWDSVDPDKIPYIEELLLRGILNGDGSGNLLPQNSITREQAAAIIKNSVDFLPDSVVSKRYFGTVESIEDIDDKTLDGIVTNRTIKIRSSNGKLHLINNSIVKESLNLSKNELTGENIKPGSKELIVYKDDEIGNSSLLSTNDRVEYIADKTNTIKFLKVISSKNTTQYVLAKIEKIDKDTSTADIFKIVDMDYPYTSLEGDSYNFNKEYQAERYTLKQDIPVYIDANKKDISFVQTQKVYLLTILNDIVTEIRNVRFNSRGKENIIISGIVEDLNPKLKYISLYDEDGLAAEDILSTRKLDVLNIDEIEITKNNKLASFEDIEPGDRAFIKMNSEGNISAISSVSSYNKKIGKVLYLKNGLLSVEFDDETQKIFRINSEIPVFEDGIKKDFSSIEAGDRLRLLLKETREESVLKEITIEGIEHLITDIYKGDLWNYDKNTVTLENVEVLKNDGFKRIFQKGFKTINVDNDIIVYKNDMRQSIDNVNKNDKGKTVYIAVEKDYLNDEKIVFMSVKDEIESERFLSGDEIYIDRTDSSTISQSGFNMSLRNDSLCVLKDRLVKPQNIVSGYKGIILMNRDFSSGSDYAGIVKIDDNIDINLQVFRARIKGIEEESNFTVYNYSVWNPEYFRWEYYGVQKVFQIGPYTRLLGNEGVKNNKLFRDYGEDSYKDKYAYIVSDGVIAYEVNEMDYSVDLIKGKIYEILPEQDVLSSEVTTLPTSAKLTDVASYNMNTLMWSEQTEYEIKLEQNTIILKKGKRIRADELSLNDKLNILKKDDTGLIIFVENG